MAFDFNQDLNARAIPHAATAKAIREGRYAFRIKSISESKTTKGAQKYEVACEIVAQADGLIDLIGTTRKQHFVTGHAKPDVAANYEADFLCLLKACGVNLAALKNAGDLYMAVKAVENAGVVLWYDVAPQPNDPKYLNWHLVLPETAEAPSPVQVPAYVAPAAPIAVAAPAYVAPAAPVAPAYVAPTAPAAPVYVAPVVVPPVAAPALAMPATPAPAYVAPAAPVAPVAPAVVIPPMPSGASSSAQGTLDALFAG